MSFGVVERNLGKNRVKLTDRKKQQIVMAAVEEFHKNGFAGTSMDQISQTADVSKRTVYNHFPSKDELYIGIVHYMFGLVAETSPQPYQPDLSFSSQLKSIARKKVELFVSEEFIRLSRVMVPEALHNPQRMQDAMAQMAAVESDMNSWFDAAIKDRKFTQEKAVDVCNNFMGIVKMDSYWPRLLKGKDVPNQQEIENLVNKAVTMFERYYGIDA